MHQNTSNKNFKIALTEGWLSILANIVLFSIKLWAGIVSASIAIIADAWHTLSDSISSIIVIIGLKISSKPADDEHPFGHGRAEIIASIIISVLLFMVGLFFIKESVLKLIHREKVQYGILAIIVTLISILVKELMAQFAFWAARKTGKKSVKADGWHHRSDALSSVIILLGIFLGKHIWWVDGILGLIVALIIIYAAYDIFIDTIHSFLGENANKEVTEKLNKIIFDISSDKLHLHHIHIHNYGNHSELTFHIKFPGHLTISEVDKTMHLIKKEVAEQMGMETTIESESI